MGGLLADKVVVILGGTTGLGLSGARACLRAGAKVVVTGRDVANVEAAGRELGADALAVAGDARAPDSTETVISAALRRFGSFDCLYHVAGGSGRKMGDGPLHECTDAGWDFTFDLNLDPMFRSNRAAVRSFLATDTPGSVLNMGSVLGLSPSPRFFSTHAYAACKAAVIGLSRAAASYYAPRGIRFNVVCPALVETPMAKRAVGDELIREFITTKQPLSGGRIGRPEDLDSAVVTLLASDFLTGQVLNVDGGWSVSEGQIPDQAGGWL
jgi:NAD(P)-dependent dehydrogenase (short-subunit alcohol dehydrogenase family)